MSPNKKSRSEYSPDSSSSTLFFNPSKGVKLPTISKRIKLWMRIHRIFPNRYSESMVRKHLKLNDSVTFLPNFKSFAGNVFCLGKASLCDTFFLDYAPIIINDGVSFGYQNMVITSTHKLSNFNEIEARQIILESNVWITCRVIILGGVTIGANSVIGAGSVVTRDIPPNVFAAGNPCKPIRNI